MTITESWRFLGAAARWRLRLRFAMVGEPITAGVVQGLVEEQRLPGETSAVLAGQSPSARRPASLAARKR
jgi:hypothetical protein